MGVRGKTGGGGVFISLAARDAGGLSVQGEGTGVIRSRLTVAGNLAAHGRIVSM